MATARRSSSSYGSFADGVIIRGMPLLTLYPGNVYWVDSNGGGGSRGTFSNPVTTLAAAHALVTSDNGDIICVKPGHAETYTDTVDFSKSGFAVIGLGFGDNRPTFTCGVTAAGDDMFDFAGDDVVIYNLKWADANPAGSAAFVFNVSGDNFHIENCYIEMGGITTGFLTHDTTAKKGLSVVNNTIVGTEAGPDFGIRVEKTHLYAHIAGNRWLFEESAGVDSGVVIFVSGTTAAGSHLIEHETVHGLTDGIAYLIQTDVQESSIMADCRIIGADATDHIGLTTAGGFGFINNAVTQEGASVPGTADHAGDPIATTPAA